MVPGPRHQPHIGELWEGSCVGDVDERVQGCLWDGGAQLGWVCVHVCVYMCLSVSRCAHTVCDGASGVLGGQNLQPSRGPQAASCCQCG